MANTKKNKTLEAAISLLHKMESDLKKTKLLISKFVEGTDQNLDLENLDSLNGLLNGLNENKINPDENMTIVE